MSKLSRRSFLAGVAATPLAIKTAGLPFSEAAAKPLPVSAMYGLGLDAGQSDTWTLSCMVKQENGWVRIAKQFLPGEPLVLELPIRDPLKPDDVRFVQLNFDGMKP